MDDLKNVNKNLMQSTGSMANSVLVVLVWLVVIPIWLITMVLVGLRTILTALISVGQMIVEQGTKLMTSPKRPRTEAGVMPETVSGTFEPEPSQAEDQTEEPSEPVQEAPKEKSTPETTQMYIPVQEEPKEEMNVEGIKKKMYDDSSGR